MSRLHSTECSECKADFEYGDWNHKPTCSLYRSKDEMAAIEQYNKMLENEERNFVGEHHKEIVDRLTASRPQVVEKYKAVLETWAKRKEMRK